MISVPSASAAVAHSSRPEKTSARAAATASATSRSLCPLAALWNSTTGFSPTSATANASRSGRTLRTRPATTNTVARLAAIAITRKVETIVPTSSAARVTSAETWVHSAPYTAGVSTHFGPTKVARTSFGKSAGVATYGFAWYVAAIFP